MTLLIIGALILAAFAWAGKEVPKITGLALPRSDAGFAHNNPGNLTELPNGQVWYGQVGVYVAASGHRFVIFDTLANGLRALCVNALSQLGKGSSTSLVAFGERWAPASDNPPAVYGDYGRQLALTLGVNAEDNYNPLSVNSLADLCHAIIVNENTNDTTGPIERSIAAAAALSHFGL